jgi:HlyD family secretion protein
MSRSIQLRPATDVVPAHQPALPLAVLEFESPSAAIIATSIPRLSRATSLYVFLLVISVLAACALIQIDKVVSAKGKLITAAPNIVLQSFDQTIVESINVRKGDIVREGQLLVRLKPTYTAADITAMKDDVDLLGSKAARLEAEMSAVEYVPDTSNPHAFLQSLVFARRTSENQSTLEVYDRKIKELEIQIARNNALAISYRTRLTIAADIERMRKALEELNAGSKLNVLAASDVSLTIRGLLIGVEADAVQASHKLGGEQAALETFTQRWAGQIATELAETRGQLVQAQQRHTKATLHNRLIMMTAPLDAIVLSVAKISVGSVVTSAEPLIQLVPIDAKLLVEADIPGIESGYVSAGNEATVKFDTLPFLRYGTARGTVRTVSADSFTPETTPRDGGSGLPGRPSILYYRAEISLDEMKLHNTPSGFRLIPGMPTTTDVKVGKRSVLAYFIDRILPIAYEGMDEP